MAKFNKRCNICKHPDREAIHADRAGNDFTYEQIQKKYFPLEKLRNIQSSCGKHFKEHWNPVEDATQAVALANSRAGLPMTATEREVFKAEARQQVQAVLTIESMMKTLMDRANQISEEWTKVHAATKCNTCGRDDNGQNLVKMLSVFRELREQAVEWMKMKNPMQAINDIAQRTFLIFVQEMTDVYVLALNDKMKAVNDAANAFLSGEINQGIFAKRLAEITSDFAADRIGDEAETRYKKIMSAATKEMKL